MSFNLKTTNRINSIAYSAVLFFVLFLLSCSSKEKKEQKEEEKQKPNVILILVDDQGYGDISALGNPFIKTPNIDDLYSKSLRFTDYHVSPTCAPTRAALLTGHHNNRAGVWNTVKGRSLLLERETTVAQIFKDNGYKTGIFGKWHLGDNYPFRPEDKGFEEVLTHGGGGMGQTMDYWNNDYFDDMYLHNGELKTYKGYSADIWFDEAIKWIDTKEDKPFFCYIPSNTAHSNYNVAEKYYKDLEGNDNIPHAPFLGMIRNIDENLGKLVSYLKESNKLDNTILLFTTDNGTAQGAKTEGHRLDGFIKMGYNAGMRGVKASKYEGGHRVPLFLYWKNGNLNVGKDINDLTTHYDIVPTLVDLCGLKVDEATKFDGLSLKPLFNDDNTNFKDRIVITNSQRVENPEPWRRTSLMQGKWRLVDGEELYNLETDPEQRNNIINEHPEKVTALRKAYDTWWAEISQTYKDQPYIYIGHEDENPMTLYCHDWHTEKEATPWHQRHIRSAFIDNGYWLVKVAETGKYNVKLRRWPKETGLALNAEASIRPAKEGTSVKATKIGKALNIVNARLKVQNFDEAKKVDANNEYVEFEVNLEAGETTCQTWFTLDDGTELGAYYVTVEKL